jgi:hypothetical protein
MRSVYLPASWLRCDLTKFCSGNLCFPSS